MLRTRLLHDDMSSAVVPSPHDDPPKEQQQQQQQQQYSTALGKRDSSLLGMAILPRLARSSTTTSSSSSIIMERGVIAPRWAGPSFFPVVADGYKDLSLAAVLDLADDFMVSLDEKQQEQPDNKYYNPPLPMTLPPADAVNCLMGSEEEGEDNLSVSSVAPPCYDPPKDTDPVSAIWSMNLESTSIQDEALSQDLSLEEHGGAGSTNTASSVTPNNNKKDSLSSSSRNKRRILQVSDDDDEETKEEEGTLSDGETMSQLLIVNTGCRFRPYQEEQWMEHFANLCAYREQQGDCLVPHAYPPNPALARWVKRQRYSYKLMKQGKPSTMTAKRMEELEGIGFVWDSQNATWKDRFHELTNFRAEKGHCNVPSKYKLNPKLATWVKCQRRQYKAYVEGTRSTMNAERMRSLESIGFEWLLRSGSGSKKNMFTADDEPASKMARLF